MTYHIWGDGFDFELLNEAIVFIIEQYFRRTGNHPLLKEKYGTIRYEYTYMWIKEDKDVIHLLQVVSDAAARYPSAAPEIVDELNYLIEETTNTKPFLDKFKEIKG